MIYHNDFGWRFVGDDFSATKNRRGRRFVVEGKKKTGNEVEKVRIVDPKSL